MGRRADDDDVWTDFELVVSRCAVSDPSKVRAKLAEYGLTVVRITAIEHAGTMLRDTLKKKPEFKISFVPDPADPDSPLLLSISRHLRLKPKQRQCQRLLSIAKGEPRVGE